MSKKDKELDLYDRENKRTRILGKEVEDYYRLAIRHRLVDRRRDEYIPMNRHQYSFYRNNAKRMMVVGRGPAFSYMVHEEESRKYGRLYVVSQIYWHSARPIPYDL